MFCKHCRFNMKLPSSIALFVVYISVHLGHSKLNRPRGVSIASRFFVVKFRGDLKYVERTLWRPEKSVGRHSHQYLVQFQLSTRLL